MPSFNQARYLGDAIDSVMDQNYPDIELIVLDGGSTDGSKELLRSRESQLAYWRSLPDLGQTMALIEGFGRATGDLLGWLNSDDILLPGALWQIAQSWAANPQAQFFGGNHIWLDQAGAIIKCKRHPRNPKRWAKHGVMVVNQPGSCFSRKAYESVGGLDGELDYVMDSDLYVRMLNAGSPFHYVDAWLSGFRVHAAAKTSAHKDLQHVEHMRALGAYWTHTFVPPLVEARFWRTMYRMWQTLNGNYARMSLETFLARGEDWRSWAARHCPIAGSATSKATISKAKIWGR